MRLKKPKYRQAVNLTISLPASYAKYASAHMRPSQLLQQAVASDVLRMDLREYWQWMMDDYIAQTYKPEPAPKLYIRAARWILESDIKDVYLANGNDRCILLRVYWTMTKQYVFCLVDFSKRFFYRVIYDAAFSGVPTGFHAAEPSAVREWMHLNAEGMKGKILSIWLAGWMAQEDK